MLRLATALVCFSIFTSAHANSDNGVQTIVTVGVHDSGNAIVAFAASNNTEVCGSKTGGTSLVISKNNPNFKMLYATALAAQLSGRQVSSWANGCIDIWGNGTTVLPQLTLIGVQ